MQWSALARAKTQKKAENWANWENCGKTGEGRRYWNEERSGHKKKQMRSNGRGEKRKELEDSWMERECEIDK